MLKGLCGLLGQKLGIYYLKTGLQLFSTAISPYILYNESQILGSQVVEGGSDVLTIGT